MAIDAAYLRERATRLRKLAEAARDAPSNKMMTRLADDFEKEARQIEAGRD